MTRQTDYEAGQSGGERRGEWGRAARRDIEEGTVFRDRVSNELSRTPLRPWDAVESLQQERYPMTT